MEKITWTAKNENKNCVIYSFLTKASFCKNYF